jgi:dCTP deaminase
MVMPSQMIRRNAFGASPTILSSAENPITEDQIQPASLDLRLGSAVYRVWSAALPRKYQPILDMVSPKERHKYTFSLDRETTNFLEKDGTYVVELMESCALPQHAWIEFSPKSSTGRCDVFARVLCNNNPHYDMTPKGYQGPLWLEITPLSFDVGVREGLSLVQGRIKTEDTHMLSNRELSELQVEHGVLCGMDGAPLCQGDLSIHDSELYYHVDLDRPVVGFVAKTNAGMSIDLTQGGGSGLLHEPKDFWVPIERPKNNRLVLAPGLFYLLATKERTRIPPTVCGQVTSFKITTGEIRPHYAGFFDPGFGGRNGTNGVLEVRARDVPFEIADGAPICSMKFERMLEVPDKLYGTGIKSSYPGSGPSLSKHFNSRYEAWQAK